MSDRETPIPDIFRHELEQIEIAQVIHEAFNTYIETLKGLETNSIRGIIIGVDVDENLDVSDTPVPSESNDDNEHLLPTFYVWNILTQDFDPHAPEDPGIYTSGIAMSKLRRSLQKYIHVRVSNVEPSHLDVLLERCKEEHILTQTEFFY